MVLLSLISLSCACGEAARPAKVLIIGNPPVIPIIAGWLEADPLTDPHLVPARTHLTALSGADIQRFIRLYFPRNYGGLLEYEYLMLIMLEIQYFTAEQQSMLRRAISEGGRGAIQDRSVMSMAEYIAVEWARSIVADVFPNDAPKVVSGKFYWDGSRLSLRYVVNTNPNVAPVFKPYKDLTGVETYLTPSTSCIAIPREGAVITTYEIGDFGPGYGYPGAYPDPRYSTGWMPHTMYWKYNNATTWTHADMLAGDYYWQPSRNPYVQDIILAELIFSTGRKLPDDVLLVHALRSKFSSFASSKGFIYSLLDFADKFGANGAPVIAKMVDIQGVADRGRQSYLETEYQAASTEMDQAITLIEALRGEAVKLKDRALFWVYLIEWISVSAISLVAGFALWTLMVRRRLYKEVAVSRLIST